MAEDILSGIAKNLVLGADSYFDESIKAPVWAISENFVKKIGRLNFYNVDLDTEGGDTNG